eukprot:Unigene9050_Nuclearia_a/m.27685 Unigene9050_Nuclearia_a/g.27685  ORF Unigene9050_Nuclearia_a/g.27685 Unigene9050_Nuclearia_a/m.27685 type:complete len:324 (-) Unigene9050_Nuclearia_a:714-1685(-)
MRVLKRGDVAQRQQQQARKLAEQPRQRRCLRPMLRVGRPVLVLGEATRLADPRVADHAHKSAAQLAKRARVVTVRDLDHAHHVPALHDVVVRARDDERGLQRVHGHGGVAGRRSDRLERREDVSGIGVDHVADNPARIARVLLPLVAAGKAEALGELPLDVRAHEAREVRHRRREHGRQPLDVAPEQQPALPREILQIAALAREDAEAVVQHDADDAAPAQVVLVVADGDSVDLAQARCEGRHERLHLPPHALIAVAEKVPRGVRRALKLALAVGLQVNEVFDQPLLHVHRDCLVAQRRRQLDLEQLHDRQDLLPGLGVRGRV